MNSETIRNAWKQPLRAALQNVHSAPVARVLALRQQFQALKGDLPRGALKAQEKAADDIERQVRRSELRALGDQVCAVLAEFGLRARIESVAQRRPRKPPRAKLAAPQEASPASATEQAPADSSSVEPSAPQEPRGGDFLRRAGGAS